MNTKTPSDSKTIMTQLVMPNDTNYLGKLMGGNLMKWMDIVGAMCASRHAERQVVTASVDNISFKSAIDLGEICMLEAAVTRVFNTSLEVHVEVWAENPVNREKRIANSAYLTFVALDQDTRKPTKVIGLQVESEQERTLYDGANRRRELRLILGGRMKPEEATDLKALFSSLN